MKLVAKVATILVKVLDVSSFFLKPNKNKITYISYNSNTLPRGMKNISNKLKELNPEYKEVYLTLKFTNNLINKIKYSFELFKQVYHVKTSQVVFIDGNNFVISNISLKDTKVIQLWHSSGAIKKFGMDYIRKYPIRNYDYMISSGDVAIPYMASAFNMPKENILPLGYAETDVLLNEDFLASTKEKLLNKYNDFIEDKKVVLYAPTFRGEAVYAQSHLEVDLQKLSDLLGDDYKIIYKIHPSLGNISLDTSNKTLNASTENIYDLFTIADILISDYSSIIYDFALLEKPVVLFAPDLDEYIEQRGIYVDYNAFSRYPITKTLTEVSEAVRSTDTLNTDDLTFLKRTFFKYTDGQSASRVANFVHSLLNN